MTQIDQAESTWRSRNIISYQLTGTAKWAGHEHAFQVVVVDGRVVDWTCELAYDQLDPTSWCFTVFKASSYVVPALFERARELLATGERLAPGQECFQAEFDRTNGVPGRMSLDCPAAHGEEEEWLMQFSGGG